MSSPAAQRKSSLPRNPLRASLPAEDGLALVQHRPYALPGVGAGAGAPGQLVEVAVLEAVAKRGRSAGRRLPPRERERRGSRDGPRQVLGPPLELRGRDDR